MAQPPNSYVKLPGRGMRRAVLAVSTTRCRLWLGADHLLAVDSTTASEEYRRFYFRDIEAFVVRQTARRQVANWIFLFLALVSAAPLLYAWRTIASVGWLVGAVAAGAFWLILALVNTLRGPTVETKVRTAVHLEQLPSLNRLPVARRVLARLAPLITAAQGEATPEELSSAPWMTPETVRRATEPEFRQEKSTLYHVLFGLLVGDAVSTAVAYGFFASANAAIALISTLTTLIGFLLCVTAVMRQGESDLPGAVRVVTKSALIFYILSFVAGFVFTITYTISHPGQQVLTGAEIMDEPGFQTVAMIAAGISAVLGIAGFLAMRVPRLPPPVA